MADLSGRNRILVVDDDPGIRSMLQFALSSRGYVVDCVANHDDAWLETPDLVLLDVRLGPYTADDFLAATGLDRRAAVIVMTAGEEPLGVTSRPGVRASIEKPFDLDELFGLVQRHCPAPARTRTE